MILNKLFLGSRYLFMVLTFLAILLISSQITTAEFGILSFFRLTLQYLMYSEFGFIQYVFRKRSADGTVPGEILNHIFSYLGISITSFCLVFALLDFQFGLFFANPLYVLFAVCAVLFGIMSKLVIDQLRITKNIFWMIVLEFSSIILIYGAILWGSTQEKSSVDIFIAAYGLNMLPYLIFALSGRVFWRKLKNIKVSFKCDKNILNGSAMLFSYGILSLVFASIDRLLIKYFVGYEALGLYAMAFTISTGFYAIIQSIFWLNMSNFIRDIKELPQQESEKNFSGYMKKIQLIYFAAVTCALPCYYILITYYNPLYEETLLIFIFLILYNYINIFYIYYRNYLLTFEHYKELNTTLLICIIFNLCLNIALLRFNSIEILVVGSITSHIIYMLLIRKVVGKLKDSKIT